jgi:hypothetical protein
MENSTNNASTGRPERLRRKQISSDDVRYFLPKPGSSPETPELGTEALSEGEALVAAFKNGSVFFTVVVWNPTTEMSNGEPRIVKQALKR